MMANYFGKTVYHYPAIDSTNNCANELIGNIDIQEGAIVLTDHQRKGRGQGGSAWESRPGENLTFSLILHPVFLPVTEQFYLSKTISLGISDYLGSLTGSISIKWPNDIYSGPDKVGGILIENIIKGNIIEYSVAGIGININQVEFPDWIPNPTSLKILEKKSYILNECLSGICAGIEKRYDLLRSGRIEDIDRDYNKRLFRFRTMTRFSSDGHTFLAEIREVMADGQLILLDDSGQTLKFYQHEIDYLDPS